MSPHHDALIAAYGFGLFPLPRYRPVSRGEWRVNCHLPSLGDGYLASSAVEARTVLVRGRQVWMSTGLLEQESHAWHVHCAQGLVVTAGLGLGLYAYAAAMKKEVDLVIAAELSPDIIALMEESSGFAGWPCRDKVRIIQADSLAPDFPARVAAASGGRPIDYLYADIWPNFPAGEAPGQTAAMAAALAPKAAGWWGQELSFGQYDPHPADPERLQAYFAAAGVPAPPITPGYAAFCRDAVAANGMTSRPSIWRRLRRLLGGAG